MIDPVQCVTLNTQISIKEKMRQLHAWIKETNFADIILVQEIGKLPPDFMFHPI